MNTLGLLLYIVTIGLSLVWFFHERGFEPVIVFLGTIIGLIYTYHNPKLYRLFAKRIKRKLTLDIPELIHMKDISVCLGADANNWQCYPGYTYVLGETDKKFHLKAVLWHRDGFKHFIRSPDDEAIKQEIRDALEKNGFVITGKGDPDPKGDDTWRTWFLLKKDSRFPEKGNGVFRKNLWR